MMERSRAYAHGIPLVLLLVFIFSFLACVSTPVSQTISLFDLDILQADVRIRAGLWGFCVVDETVSLQCSKARIGLSLKNMPDSNICPFSPDQGTGARICTGALADLGNLLPPGLTGSLLVHVFAGVLAFVTFFLASVFALRPDLQQRMGDRLSQFNNSNQRFTRQTATFILPLLFTSQLAVQLTVALILDIAVVSSAKRNATKSGSELTVSYGSVTWVILIAAILAWVILVTQIIEPARLLRYQISRTRTSMHRNSTELRSRPLSTMSSFSSSPESLQSRSPATGSESDRDNDSGYLTNPSRRSGSKAPRKTPSWSCCGSRESSVCDNRKEVSTTLKTPPQHRRFSWEPHDENEVDTSTETRSTVSTPENDQYQDQSSQSSIFACLPCLKRTKPKPEPAAEEIELQDIVVSRSRDDSSSASLQSAIRAEDPRDTGSNGIDAAGILPQDKNRSNSKQPYLTWANIRKALQETFSPKEKTKNIPNDTYNEKHNEEPGDNGKNAGDQPSVGQIRNNEPEDPSPGEGLANENGNPAQERASEPEERAIKINEKTSDDVSATDDESQEPGPIDISRKSQNDDEKAPEESEALEDVIGEEHEAQAKGLTDYDLDTPEDTRDDDFRELDDVADETIPEQERRPESEGENRQVKDEAEQPGEDITKETEDAEPAVQADTNTDPVADAGDVCEEDNAESNTSSPSSARKLGNPHDCTEKATISCRGASELRPDEHVVKHHSFVEVGEDVAGKPLVCIACGAYIYVRADTVH